MNDKVVITCALTGVLTDPRQHPVPVTPDEMAREAKAAFDAGALAQSIPGYSMSSTENSYILSHGGYSSWVFVGLEDLNGAATDDWNDFIFAFDPPAVSVPEPGTLAFFGAALMGAFTLRRRKAR